MYELPLVKLIASRLNEKRLRIQVVAGPRQVGKTTAVKQALKHYGKPFTYRLAEGLGAEGSGERGDGDDRKHHSR